MRKKTFTRIPFAGMIAIHLHKRAKRFPGSQGYWEQRYNSGGNSGAGSYGKLAVFKADIINSFIKEYSVESVIEFGCGDGNQLSLANYPKYIGLDVSPTAIKLCKDKFVYDRSKSFFLYNPQYFAGDHNIFQADLSLSLDVIYHLIEDEVFHEYMVALFNSSNKYVIIYSINYDEKQSYHQKNRQFTKWVDRYAMKWQLFRKIDNLYPYDFSDPENTSISDFYIYKKIEVNDVVRS